MHYSLEIIMPPTDDVEEAVATIMDKFSENNESEDASSFKFWDWYQIGGRYSGNKLRAKVGPEELRVFEKMLDERGVTVSSFQFGKPELSPASQIPEVDRLWKEMFPGAGNVCPLFKHSGESAGNDDICTLSEMPEKLTAYAVIVAGPKFEEAGFEAQHMVHKSMWNGVSHIDTKWDGFVSSAIQSHLDFIKGCRDEWREKRTPQPNWLVVTVDYHS